MKLRTSLYLQALSLVIIFIANSGFASDYDVRQLESDGHIMKLSRLIEKVTKTTPGRIIDAQLGEEQGKMVYDIELIDHSGVIWELSLDAKSGELLHKHKE